MGAPGPARSNRDVRLALFAIALGACSYESVPAGDAAGTTPMGAPPDPFAGLFADPSALPRASCTPGSLAGFALPGYWPELAMRTATPADLQVFVMTGGERELLATHALTADDLFVRSSTWTGSAWVLRVIDACAADADGALRGSELACDDVTSCEPRPFSAAPLHRLAGETAGDHLALVGELGGSPPTRAVRVLGDTAFVAQGNGGMRVIGIANPAAPVELARWLGVRDVADVELVRGVDGRHNVLVAGAPGCQIVDVEDAANPRAVADLPFAATAVVVDGTTAYFVADTARVEVWDVSLATRPKRVAGYGTGPARWHDVFVANGIAYLADPGSGIHVVDFRDPAVPGELAAEPAASARASSLATVHGRALVLAGSAAGLRVLDAATLAPTGAFQVRPTVPIADLRTAGSRAIVAHHRDGIRIVELADPAAPVAAGYFNTWVEGTGSASALEGAVDVDVDRQRGRIYVADTIRGFVILQADATVFPPG